MASIEVLKKAKKEQKLTLDELAARSGVAKRTIEDILQGKTKNPRVDTMQALEQALGLSSPEFTDEEKAAGVGAHGVKLSEAEWEWLELRSEIIHTKGERGLHAIETIIKTYIEEK